MTPSSDLAILGWLARHAYSPAPAIAAACGLMPGEVRGALARLERAHCVVGRYDMSRGAPRRVYFITDEGRRAAGISDTRSTT